MSTLGGVQYTGVSIQINCFPNNLPSPIIIISSGALNTPPPSVLMISLSVLMISLQCTAQTLCRAIRRETKMQGIRILHAYTYFASVHESKTESVYTHIKRKIQQLSRFKVQFTIRKKFRISGVFGSRVTLSKARLHRLFQLNLLMLLPSY